MKIDPISNVKTTQAQTVAPKVNANTATNKTSGENATYVPAADLLDNTTKTVENSSKKGINQSTNPDQSDSDKLKKAVEQLNKNMANSEAIYGIHEGTNRVTIKIVDRDTKKVIKELPPEKTLDMIAKVWEMAGILVDEKK